MAKAAKGTRGQRKPAPHGPGPKPPPKGYRIPPLNRSFILPIPYRLAEQVILKYERIGTMAPTALHYGLWFGPYLAGVCCVGISSIGLAGTTHHKALGVDRNEVAVLARGATLPWAPKGSGSRLVAWTCKLTRRDSASRILFAFADPSVGEIGTIYQASGWSYLGMTGLRTASLLVSPDGLTRMNRRRIGNEARASGVPFATVRDRLINLGWTYAANTPKHKYVKVLDRGDAELTTRVASLSRPYPRRAGSADSGTPVNHAGGGGALPTPALA